MGLFFYDLQFLSNYLRYLLINGEAPVYLAPDQKYESKGSGLKAWLRLVEPWHNPLVTLLENSRIPPKLSGKNVNQRPISLVSRVDGENCLPIFSQIQQVVEMM